MTYLLVDLFGIALVIAGLVMAVKKPRRRPGASSSGADADDDPRVYVRRIAGFMLAAFGLALTVMFTTFHFA
jgi:hypothetical protein